MPSVRVPETLSVRRSEGLFVSSPRIKDLPILAEMKAAGRYLAARTNGKQRRGPLLAAFVVYVFLGLIQSAQAKIITITITGTVSSGTDNAGVFGITGANLANVPFTLVFTIDDTKGTQTVTDCSGVPCVSQFTNDTQPGSLTAPENPGRAVLQIGGGSYTLGAAIGNYYQDYTLVSRSAGPGNNNLQLTVQDNVENLPSGIAAFQDSIGGTVYPSSGNMFSSSYNWQDSFSVSQPGLGPSVFLFYVYSLKNGTTTVEVSAGLIPSSVSVSGGSVARTQGNCGCQGASGSGRDTAGGATPDTHGQASVGGPITVSTGNMYEQFTDYTTAGANPLDFTRYYNSMENITGLQTFATSLGTNWRTTYDRYLHVGTSTVVAERADGQQLTFYLAGSNWTTDSDLDVTLKQSGSTWTLTDHNDMVESYIVNNSGEGLLSTIVARNGYTQTVAHNSSGQLQSVKDSYNRSLQFTYSNGMLETVTTPDALVLTFAETAATGGSQLTSVSYNTTPATSQTYLYENSSFPFALAGIIDENGNRFASWGYDSSERGISSQQGTGANLVTLAYNGDGSTTVTNALGVADTYSFHTLQGVPKVTQIRRASTSTTAAATETFTYDSNGYMASRTDWNGNQTIYADNAHGDPTTINEAVGSAAARTTTITYDSTWVHLPGTITTSGISTTYKYDGYGELLTKTLTDTTTGTTPYSTSGQQRIWTNTWSNFLLASTQTPNGNTTKFGYDTTGALTSITDALKHVTNITAHTGGGLPQTILDPNGVTTTLAYDPRQRLNTSTVSGTGGTYKTTWTYDAAGNLVTTTLPDNSYLTNTYDTAHRLIQVTDALANYTSFTLDALGDRIKTNIYKSDGTLTWHSSGTFDALGRLLANTAGAGQTTTQTFDPNGNVLTVTDGLSHTTTNTYDALNRLSSSADANSGVTTPAYDTHDRIVSVTDANGNATSYIRDGFGDVIQQSSPDSGSTVFYYDGDANLTSKTDALGIVTNQTFDGLDRPLTTTYPAHPAENVAYTYDQTGTGFAFGIGKLTSVTDAAGSLTRTYEERGNLATETRVNGTTTLVTNYTYDGANRVASMTYPDGTLVSYGHDAAGYTSTVTAKPSGSAITTALATLTHQPFGPQNGVTYGNGIAEAWTYDKSYRATNIADVLSGAGLQNLSYAYDSANNVGSITDTVNPGNSQALGYDPLNRLVSAASGSGGYGGYSWTYDKVGNRLTQIAGGAITAYAYATGTNRLATITTSAATAQLRRMPGLPRFYSHTREEGTQLAQQLTRPLTQGPRSTPHPLQNVRQPAGLLTTALGWPMLFTGFGGILVFRKRLRSNRGLAIMTILACMTGATTLLTGCVKPVTPSGQSTTASPALTLNGVVHGGQQPVTGATIQLYAVGTTGDGSAATPLIASAVLSDANGNFTITSKYTCPSTTTEVYLVATGGNPGLAAGTNNAAISLMAALGQCGSLTSSTFISVDEVTTIGSLAALYPYMSATANLGSGSADAAQLGIAFNSVSEFTNTGSGSAPGPALPSGYYASSAQINTLGNIIASCINSAGGTAGDGSACGNLFLLTAPSGGSAPTDTIGALLNILNNPTLNVADVFNLSATLAPFQPSLSSAPLTWNLSIVPIPATPTFLPAPGTYVSGGLVELDDTTAGATIYYTTDGSTPTTNSTKYTGAISVASTETIQTIATAPGNTNSGVGTGTYTITGSGGTSPSVVTVVTNANGNITGIPSTDGVSYVNAAYNNANRLSSVTGTPVAAAYTYDWAGQRYSKTEGGTPPTIYSYAQGGTLISENDNGTVTDYIYADGRPIAVLQPGATTTADQVNYVHADRLGTPRIVTNSSGSTVWKTTYQPFGTTGTISAAINQNLRFPGQIFDAETGFSYNLSRDYMPNLGRYLETDPLGLISDANTYLYTTANPLLRTDPLGLTNVNSLNPGDPGYGTLNNYNPPGVFSFGAHGFPNGPFGIPFPNNYLSTGVLGPEGHLSVPDVANAILNNNWDGNEPIELDACYGGAGGDKSFAQQLANYLSNITGIPVTVWATPNPLLLANQGPAYFGPNPGTPGSGSDPKDFQPFVGVPISPIQIPIAPFQF